MSNMVNNVVWAITSKVINELDSSEQVGIYHVYKTVLVSELTFWGGVSKVQTFASCLELWSNLAAAQSV